MGPGASPGVPTGLRHLPLRNNYPDAVFDHYFADAVEARLPFIGVDGFLCDPQGVTLRRTLLHEIFTNLCFCSTAIPEAGTGECRPSRRCKKAGSMNALLEPWLSQGRVLPFSERQVT